VIEEKGYVNKKVIAPRLPTTFHLKLQLSTQNAQFLDPISCNVFVHTGSYKLYTSPKSAPYQLLNEKKNKVVPF